MEGVQDYLDVLLHIDRQVVEEHGDAGTQEHDPVLLIPHHASKEHKLKVCSKRHLMSAIRQSWSPVLKLERAE